jgi:hypothetical protein
VPIKLPVIAVTDVRFARLSTADRGGQQWRLEPAWRAALVERWWFPPFWDGLAGVMVLLILYRFSL